MNNLFAHRIAAVVCSIWVLGVLPLSTTYAGHHSILPQTYRSVDGKYEFICRNVPGDGSCLFHSLSACITQSRCKNHLDFDGRLRKLSRRLRELSINVLRNDNAVFTLENSEQIQACELLRQAAQYQNKSVDEYCSHMAIGSTWGGGPEIVALSNHFKRPIHVYELAPCGYIRRQFQFKMCAAFGSPTFDDKTPYYILCADGRFPHIKPGEQKENGGMRFKAYKLFDFYISDRMRDCNYLGDHFLALFPCEKPSEKSLFSIFSFFNPFRRHGRELSEGQRRSMITKYCPDQPEWIFKI